MGEPCAEISICIFSYFSGLNMVHAKEENPNQCERAELKA